MYCAHLINAHRNCWIQIHVRVQMILHPCSIYSANRLELLTFISINSIDQNPNTALIPPNILILFDCTTDKYQSIDLLMMPDSWDSQNSNVHFQTRINCSQHLGIRFHQLFLKWKYFQYFQGLKLKNKNFPRGYWCRCSKKM